MLVVDNMSLREMYTELVNDGPNVTAKVEYLAFPFNSSQSITFHRKKINGLSFLQPKAKKTRKLRQSLMFAPRTREAVFTCS